MKRKKYLLRRLFDKVFPPKDFAHYWWARVFPGHITIGPIVIYGFNAMHGAVNIHTRWGWICFHPTMRICGRWWAWYFYISPDATPQSATYRLGPGCFD